MRRQFVMALPPLPQFRDPCWEDTAAVQRVPDVPLPTNTDSSLSGEQGVRVLFKHPRLSLESEPFPTLRLAA